MRNMDKFLHNSLALIRIELDRVNMLCKHTDLATDIRLGEPHYNVACDTHDKLIKIQKHLNAAISETFMNICHTEYPDGTVRD